MTQSRSASPGAAPLAEQPLGRPAPGRPAPLPARATVATALRQLARELPIAVTVRGDCMAPRLRDGDRVAVAAARRYWPGDVVAFHTPQGRIALHRLLGYRWLGGRLACVTRGDRCGRADAPLPPGRLLGRAAVAPTPADRARAMLAFLALALRAARRRLGRALRPSLSGPPAG
jgi:Peptidase S24-like